MKLRKEFILLGICVILLVLSQITRFENKLTIAYDGANMTAKIFNISMNHTLYNLTFDKITASFQKSMVAENGLSFLEVYDENGKVVYSYNRFVLYVFGKDVLGTMTKGTHASFKPSFGDWSMDRWMSKNVVVYNETLPPQFVINAVFTGRGHSSLAVEGKEMIHFDISDGFLDTVFNFCTDKCYPASTDRREPVFMNIMRMVNFFVEAFLLSCIIILAVFLLNLISGGRKR